MARLKFSAALKDKILGVTVVIGIIGGVLCVVQFLVDGFVMIFSHLKW